MKTREEIIKKAQELLACGALSKDACDAIKADFPELSESEDERINRVLLELVSNDKTNGYTDFYKKKGITCDDAIAYLEKQKEQKLAIMKPHKGDGRNPYDMGVSEAQEYAIKRGFGIPFNDGEVYVDERHLTQTIGNILRWADEHPKEQKPALRLVGDGFYTDPNSHFELEGEQKPAEEELLYRLNGLMQDYIKEGNDDKEREHRFKCYQLFLDALEDTNFFEQKEQQPNIELIQRSWYMEGYHDREFCREPKWVIKTGEGGPRYEKNEKYEQPLEQNPTEWSEEDNSMMIRVFVAYDALRSYIEDNEIMSEKDKNYQIKMLEGEVCWLKNWLKSILPYPHWKPSEEQMKALRIAYEIGTANESWAMSVLKSLYEQLKNL